MGRTAARYRMIRARRLSAPRVAHESTQPTSEAGNRETHHGDCITNPQHTDWGKRSRVAGTGDDRAGQLCAAHTMQTSAMWTPRPGLSPDHQIAETPTSRTRRNGRRAEVRERKQQPAPVVYAPRNCPFNANEPQPGSNGGPSRDGGTTTSACDWQTTLSVRTAPRPRCSNGPRGRQAWVTRTANIPVGAQMFWETSHPVGHIATYVGNGKVVTNMPGGAVEMVDWRRLERMGASTWPKPLLPPRPRQDDGDRSVCGPRWLPGLGD